MADDPKPKPVPLPPNVPLPPDAEPPAPPAEIGGPQGPEPTRYGDWEKKGIAVDF